MAAKKAVKAKKGRKTKAEEATSQPLKASLSSSLPGIILAAGIAFWRYHSSGENVVINRSSSSSSDVTQSPPYYNPKPGSWDDGYYSSPVPDQNIPSTYAIIYPNGGIGEPTEAIFETEQEFLSAGRLYNDLGQIVQSRFHFENGTALYSGPTKPGTHFQWPAVTVGHKRPVPGVVGGTGTQIELETLTEPTSDPNSDPRVFYVHNFLSAEETDELIRFSTADENQYKMRPSTGGTHKAWNQGGSEARLTTRTSENAFDMQTKNAANIKRRAFRLMRMGGYREELADGIQILRYELGQAYVAHHDFFPERQSDDHNWDPLRGGSNRLATVFLYLSDVEYGGQTVFPLVDKLTSEKSEELVRRLGDAPSEEMLKNFVADAGLKTNSWEDKLIEKCYGRFAVPPRRGDAILFYSQKPDGEMDRNSLHGACPVLKGTKWGANLWIWNSCRYSLCSVDPLNPVGELPEEMSAPYEGGYVG
uniref:Fe2OG dioxygenase domain-containing protein n=2 Tax=Skeletonema marinoi TaxID=267567 RepID=A0A7S2Q2T0_9STRA|mmetsp:Transcript_8513/g.14450  ORF Transcript_8513/g.14450 Transcript_8513/m.14450 type:complete len:476 (+) Transcript_8513:43-1470(+)